MEPFRHLTRWKLKRAYRHHFKEWQRLVDLHYAELAQKLEVELEKLAKALDQKNDTKEK